MEGHGTTWSSAAVSASASLVALEIWRICPTGRNVASMAIRLGDGKVGPNSGSELLLEGGGESERYRNCEDAALSGQRMCRMNEPAALQVTHELPRADQIPNVSASPVSCAD